MENRGITVDDVLKILKGASNGIAYGAKVRFMHSLIMSILFMKGSALSRIKMILKMTAEHSLRLGAFVLVYKTVQLLLRKLEGKNTAVHNFIAGILGSYVINLDGDTPVNQQITLYIISRVVLGGGKSLQKRGYIPKFDLYKVISVGSWASVMLIYAWNKTKLQPSMAQSMDFLYRQSDKYHGWTDYVPVYMPLNFKEKIEHFMAVASKSMVSHGGPKATTQ